MHLTEEPADTRYQIRVYHPGHLQINTTVYTESMLVGPDLLHPWRPQRFEDMTIADLTLIFERRPQVLLLGTGGVVKALSPEISAALLTAGIGVECCHTRAACQTFRLLAQEGRDVIAALIVPE